MLCTKHWRTLTGTYVSRPLTYNAAHKRVYRLHGPARARACVQCGQPAAHWAYDNLDPNERTAREGRYSPDPEHYQPMCQPCHQHFDLQEHRGGDQDGVPQRPRGKAQRRMNLTTSVVK